MVTVMEQVVLVVLTITREVGDEARRWHPAVTVAWQHMVWSVAMMASS